MVFKVFSVDIRGYNGSEIQCCRKNTFSCIELLTPITEHVDSGQHLSLLMLMSLNSCFARQIPKMVLFLESKSSRIHPQSLFLSRSPLQCCCSSVNHHDLHIQQLFLAQEGLVALVVNSGVCSGGTSDLPIFASLPLTPMRCVMSFFCLELLYSIWTDTNSAVRSACKGPQPGTSLGYNPSFDLIKHLQGGWGERDCDTPDWLLDLMHSQSVGLELTKSQTYTINASVHISSTSCSETDILHANLIVFIVVISSVLCTQWECFYFHSLNYTLGK